jgi:hypothetical protein
VRQESRKIYVVTIRERVLDVVALETTKEQALRRDLRRDSHVASERFSTIASSAPTRISVPSYRDQSRTTAHQ